jgi:hypothetical protein
MNPNKALWEKGDFTRIGRGGVYTSRFYVEKLLKEPQSIASGSHESCAELHW